MIKEFFLDVCTIDNIKRMLIGSKRYNGTETICEIAGRKVMSANAVISKYKVLVLVIFNSCDAVTISYSGLIILNAI